MISTNRALFFTILLASLVLGRKWEVNDTGKSLKDSIINKMLGGHNSANRKFYVRLTVSLQMDDIMDSVLGLNNRTCGGALIEEGWVLTAASCITGSVLTYVDDITVEVRDFSDRKSKGHNYIVEHQYIHPSYDARKHTNDIALLRLSDDVGKELFLPPCALNAPLGSLVAVCAMGSVLSSFPDITADRLREGYFDEVPFKCREDSVCVEPLFETSRYEASLCESDNGSPLYMMDFAQKPNPECVYGVVSHWGKRVGEPCSGYSHFTSVAKFYPWIRSTIDRYENSEYHYNPDY